jgi:uncharacterized protein (DUF2235 family)
VKRIAIYLDGTWDNGGKDPSNVYKLAKSTPVTSAQTVIYHDGIGVSNDPLEHIFGGAYGLGLFGILKDVYGKICHIYESGDELFICGFSRGAFTARALAGWIADVGLPIGSFQPGLVDASWEAYQDPSKRAAAAAQFGLFCPLIKVVAAFDTVAAVGLLGAPDGGNDPLIAGFLDTTLHPCIQNAFQALAIDEHRAEFNCEPWQQGNPQKVAGQVLEQVWFCGCHSDIGGGSGSGLTDIALGWISSKLISCGLALDPMPDYPVDAKHALAPFQDSWSIKWLLPKRRDIPLDAVLSNSVAVRCAEVDGYQPKNLQLENGLPAGHYGTEAAVLPQV